MLKMQAFLVTRTQSGQQLVSDLGDLTHEAKGMSMAALCSLHQRSWTRPSRQSWDISCTSLLQNSFIAECLILEYPSPTSLLHKLTRTFGAASKVQVFFAHLAYHRYQEVSFKGSQVRISRIP